MRVDARRCRIAPLCGGLIEFSVPVLRSLLGLTTAPQLSADGLCARRVQGQRAPRGALLNHAPEQGGAGEAPAGGGLREVNPRRPSHSLALPASTKRRCTGLQCRFRRSRAAPQPPSAFEPPDPALRRARVGGEVMEPWPARSTSAFDPRTRLRVARGPGAPLRCGPLPAPAAAAAPGSDLRRSRGLVGSQPACG